MTKFERYNFINASTAKPMPVKQQLIEVEINSNELFLDYAKNFINEGYRKHPKLAEIVNLTEEEMVDYINFLVYHRVRHANGDFKGHRDLSLLVVPSWIEYTLSNIGSVTLRDKGLRFIPTFNREVITYEEAMVISDRIDQFADELQVTRNAFPRSSEGDMDLMTTAIIASYVHSLDQVPHPVVTYLTAFLGLKLREENAFKILYRIRYDDIEYLRHAIDSEGRHLC